MFSVRVTLPHLQLCNWATGREWHELKQTRLKIKRRSFACTIVKSDPLLQLARNHPAAVGQIDLYDAQIAWQWTIGLSRKKYLIKQIRAMLREGTTINGMKRRLPEPQNVPLILKYYFLSWRYEKKPARWFFPHERRRRQSDCVGKWGEFMGSGVSKFPNRLALRLRKLSSGRKVIPAQADSYAALSLSWIFSLHPPHSILRPSHSTFICIALSFAPA